MDYSIVTKNLQKRGFIPYFAETTDEAVNYILGLIPNGSSVGFGGSVTVSEICLLEAMKDKYLLLHRSLFDSSQAAKVMEESHTADWYVASTNALTVNGDLINIDGRANRVAEMLNGPKNVLIVLGVNKIVNDIAEGISRVRNVAAPANTKRLNKNTPCAVTGKCSYCNSPDTICKATVIQHHPTTGQNVHVVIINKNLGY